jgi:hypothetical protein
LERVLFQNRLFPKAKLWNERREIGSFRVSGDTGGIGGGDSALFSGIGGGSRVPHPYAHVAQLDEKHDRLAANNERRDERKEPSGIFRELGRPSQFAIWTLGIIALFGGVLLAYISARLGGIWPLRE